MKTFYIDWKSILGHVDTFEILAENEIQARESFENEYPNFEISHFVRGLFIFCILF